MTNDKQIEIEQMKQTLDLKRTVIEDMKEQLQKIRDETTFDMQAQERTLSIKLTERDRKELELSMKLNQT